MKQFISVKDAGNINALINEALIVKSSLHANPELGKGKTLGLLFLNPSLRTRMSTQKAAYNLGMNVIVLNLNNDSWQIEFDDGAVMNGNKSEHIKEAAAVVSQYCDIIGIRCFPGLTDRVEDYSEKILNSFIQYCSLPIISLESATRHPLQSFADMISIAETHKTNNQPKVVLTWAPHIKALPQAVPNSFAEWAIASGAEVIITHPEGYELDEQLTKGATVVYNQEEALNDADFVYVKNWSSYNKYGTMPAVKENWMLTLERLQITNEAKVMHCLPVRRNVELSDKVIDSNSSIIQLQAGNRVVAAQTILKKMLKQIPS
jgi:N-succinyl-L-ornithine transcarbamylase